MTSRLLGFFGFVASWLLGISPAFAGPAPAPASGASRVPAAPSPFLNVGRLGEWAAQAALREGHLLSHLRGIDPFGITIRGPYKGLPVAEHPAEKPNPLNLAAAAAKYLHSKKPYKLYRSGGVNARGREILVGSRSIHEGDLLVLESGGSHFVVWVQSVEERGVLFCDIDLQKHILRPVGSRAKRVTGCSCPKRIAGRSRLWNTGY